MAGFRVLPIDSELAEAVRSTLKSPQYGHPAHVERATGYGPCRACLKQFRQGEEDRILFTYNPFQNLDEYPSPGPIFIHAHSCPSYNDVQTFPDELRSLPLTLEAYGENRWIIAANVLLRMRLKTLWSDCCIPAMSVTFTYATLRLDASSPRLSSIPAPGKSTAEHISSRKCEAAAGSSLRYDGCDSTPVSQGDFASCVDGYAPSS